MTTFNEWELREADIAIRQQATDHFAEWIASEGNLILWLVDLDGAGEGFVLRNKVSKRVTNINKEEIELRSWEKVSYAPKARAALHKYNVRI